MFWHQSLTRFLVGVVLCFGLGLGGSTYGQDQDDAKKTAFNPPFDIWLKTLKSQARAQGISDQTLAQAFPKSLRPNKKVIGYDRFQPEFNQNLWSYLNRAINQKRINRGKKLLAIHAPFFTQVYQKYRVQPRFLVAFWGLESNFGDHTGGFFVPEALATLAHDQRRSAFFRNELFYVLSLMENNRIPLAKLKGSWAGAMGDVQFMPSTFVNHATDGDGDGQYDLWQSLPDIMFSAANYLANIGWKGDETWGREVRLPKDFDLEMVGVQTKLPIGQWAAMGVRNARGNALPTADIEGAIILPAGITGPAFLVYNNYEKILIWNRSELYAIAVGLLADQLGGRPGLVAKAPKSTKQILRADIKKMQEKLNRLGFASGKPDGMVGPMTRKAIKAYQKQNNLPMDGYPSPALIKQILN